MVFEVRLELGEIADGALAMVAAIMYSGSCPMSLATFLQAASTTENRVCQSAILEKRETFNSGERWRAKTSPYQIARRLHERLLETTSKSFFFEVREKIKDEGS